MDIGPDGPLFSGDTPGTSPDASRLALVRTHMRGYPSIPGGPDGTQLQAACRQPAVSRLCLRRRRR